MRPSSRRPTSRRRVARCAWSGRRSHAVGVPACVPACCRVRDLDETTRASVVHSAEAWRDGEVERGFSMALGRLADPADAEAVLVTCRDGSGELRGLLQLVPWGADGLSLDVMRRDRSAENGVIELMVTDLLAEAPRLGVTRVSLNFAVFRQRLRTRRAPGRGSGAPPLARGPALGLTLLADRVVLPGECQVPTRVGASVRLLPLRGRPPQRLLGRPARRGLPRGTGLVAQLRGAPAQERQTPRARPRPSDDR